MEADAIVDPIDVNKPSILQMYYSSNVFSLCPMRIKVSKGVQQQKHFKYWN